MNEIGNCRIHGVLIEDQYFIEKTNSKRGYTVRCKLCRIASRIKNSFNCKVHGKLEPDDIYEHGGCKKCNREKVGKYKKNNRALINKKVAEDKIKNPEKWEAYNKRLYKQQVDKYGALLSLKKICDERGIIVEQYQEMVEKQNNLCGICKLPETRIVDKNGVKMAARLSINNDCHKTNVVRGLLCRACNQAIGSFNDNTQRLYAAIRWIKLGGFNGD